MRAPDHALEDIVVPAAVGRGRIGMRNANDVAEFAQEQGIVGAFLSTLPPLPAGDEGVSGGGHARGAGGLSLRHVTNAAAMMQLYRYKSDYEPKRRRSAPARAPPFTRSPKRA